MGHRASIPGSSSGGATGGAGGAAAPPIICKKRGKKKEKEKEKREEREKGKGEKERRGKKKKRSKFPSLAMVRRRGKLPLAPSDTLPPCGMLTDAVLKLLVFVFSAHFPHESHLASHAFSPNYFGKILATPLSWRGNTRKSVSCQQFNHYK